MDNNKLDTIANSFESKEIRSVWNSEKGVIWIRSIYHNM